MAKKVPKAPLLDYSCLADYLQTIFENLVARKPFALSPIPGVPVPSDITTYRQALERQAMDGDIAALADLVRLDVRYLGTPQVIATVGILRLQQHWAVTKAERAVGTKGLKLLADALSGYELRGVRPHAEAWHVAMLYDLLLPAYRVAKRTGATCPVKLPRELWRYFNGRDSIPEGMVSAPKGTPPSFTIPQEDLKWLEDEKPSDVALERVMTLLGIGRGSDDDRDLTWARKLVARGRKSMA